MMGRPGAQQADIRFQVSGFRFQVSGFRFQVSGLRFQVSGLRSQVSGLRSQVRAETSSLREASEFVAGAKGSERGHPHSVRPDDAANLAGCRFGLRRGPPAVDDFQILQSCAGVEENHPIVWTEESAGK
jgi:hypothetical protein